MIVRTTGRKGSISSCTMHPLTLPSTATVGKETRSHKERDYLAAVERTTERTVEAPIDWRARSPSSIPFANRTRPAQFDAEERAGFS